MDISSLPEAEQQKLNQLNQQFHEHKAQQQQQIYDHQQHQVYEQPQQKQQYGNYSYYPQTYDYSHYQQHDPQQQHYVYYPQPVYDYSYQQQLPHHPVQQAQSVVTNSAQFASAAQQSMNPAAAAAVAALSQLSQYAGKMDASQRGMAGPGVHYGPSSFPQASSSQYRGRGRGRRGGGLSRGGGRGNFGNRNFNSGGSGPPSRGRGRNPAKGLTIKPTEALVIGPKEAEQSIVNPKSSQVAPNQQPARGPWCELCQVECNSLEILEQHKSGKRHKKNLLRTEALKEVVKPIAEIQNVEEPAAWPMPDVHCQSESPKEAEGEKPDGKSSPKAENDHHIVDEQQQTSTAGQTAAKSGLDQVENGKRGVKRKTRVGKKIKTSREIEPAPKKPKVVIPVVCDLCNVKCDTREVFDKHLGGKKHIAKVKKFQGHQTMYGPMGLQALYPPNPIAQTRLHQDYDPQGSNPPPTSYVPPVSYQAVPHQEYDPQGSNPTPITYAPPASYQAVVAPPSGSSDPYNPYNPGVESSFVGTRSSDLGKLTPNLEPVELSFR